LGHAADRAQSLGDHNVAPPRHPLDYSTRRSLVMDRKLFNFSNC
jgi:hypothetical protein